MCRARAVEFMRSRNASMVPASCTASSAATLLADGSSSASSAWRSVSRSPALTGRTDCDSDARHSSSATSAGVIVIVKPAAPGPSGCSSSVR